MKLHMVKSGIGGLKGGKLYCTDLGERVKIAGEAMSYLEVYIDVWRRQLKVQ